MILEQKWLTSGLAILLAGVLSAFALGALRVTASSSAYGPATVASARPIPAFKHIFVIVMENEDYTEVIGRDKAPYITSLARQYGAAANFYGIRHPSLPNYLALTGGDTFGITSDCTGCFVGAPNLVDQLEAAGKSWKAYMEGMPHACFVGDAAPLYKQKHNPFIYYDNVRNDPARCAKIVPFTQFAADAQSNTLPDFVWITPNMCNDMHDCPVSAGDTWLKQWVPAILQSPAWKDGGALFITFDEGTGMAGCCGDAVGGRIATLVLSPLGRVGFTSQVAYTHYSLLRTIEAAWSLPLLGHANCDCALPMADFFTPPGSP
jgi:acid phosphatase